jgi:hypothetical protein
MLIEFDQNTIANMTAALEWVCKKLPPDKDTREARKQIADATIESARKGRRTYFDFHDAGSKVLKSIVEPPRFSWRLSNWFFARPSRRAGDGPHLEGLTPRRRASSRSVISSC